MAELVAGSTAVLPLTPPVLEGATVELASVTVKDRSGADVEHTTGSSEVVILADALVLGARITATAKWDVTIDGGVQHRTTTVSAFVLLDDYPGYGSVDAVDRLLTMVELSATSTPNVTGVADTAGMVRRIIDARLGAAAIKTPLTDASVVADAENLLVAASLLESIVIAHGGDGSATVETWRKQAESVLKPICDGKMGLPGEQTVSTPDANPAGVSNTASAFSDDEHSEFVAAYGQDVG